MGSEKASWPPEVVDVFKALLEFTEEEEINLEDFTLFEVDKAYGWIFPRPRW